MRMSKASGWCASLVAMAAALVALSTATDARADEEFTATGGSGSVRVIPKGHWHINQDAPWKVTAGAVTFTGKIDKGGKWSLTENKAEIASGIPAGDVKVKVYVCDGDKCKNAEVTVHVN